MDYRGFTAVWKKGAKNYKRSHQVEEYFMGWEGFQSERKKWLGGIDFKLRGFEAITV